MRQLIPFEPSGMFLEAVKAKAYKSSPGTVHFSQIREEILQENLIKLGHCSEVPRPHFWTPVRYL